MSDVIKLRISLEMDQVAHLRCIVHTKTSKSENKRAVLNSGKVKAIASAAELPNMIA